MVLAQEHDHLECFIFHQEQNSPSFSVSPPLPFLFCLPPLFFTVLGYIFQVVHFQKSAGVTSDYTTLTLQTNKADLITKNNHPLLSISVKLPTLTIPHYITWSRDLLGPHCATPYFGQVPASRVSPEEFSAVKTPASVTSVR